MTAQNTNNNNNNTNVVVLEHQQPAAPQIIYVGPQTHVEEKKEESELEQLIGCWYVSPRSANRLALTDILLAVHLFGVSLPRSCARAAVLSLEDAVLRPIGFSILVNNFCWGILGFM